MNFCGEKCIKNTLGSIIFGVIQFQDKMNFSMIYTCFYSCNSRRHLRRSSFMFDIVCCSWRFKIIWLFCLAIYCLASLRYIPSWDSLFSPPSPLSTVYSDHWTNRSEKVLMPRYNLRQAEFARSCLTPLPYHPQIPYRKIPKRKSMKFY